MSTASFGQELHYGAKRVQGGNARWGLSPEQGRYIGAINMYLHVTVKLKVGVPFGQYKALVNKIKPTFEKHGWRLEKGLVSVTGRVNSVINIWHVPNAEALQAGLFDPDLRRNIAEVREVVEDEVLNLMMPYLSDETS